MTTTKRFRLVRPPAPLEHTEQVFLIQQCRRFEARVPELGLLYAIPNGGDRDIRVAARLKAEGVRAGVPDLHLPVARGDYHSLYVEMKREGNTPTDAQKDMHVVLRAAGNRVEVCYSWPEAWNVLMDYLGRPELRV